MPALVALLALATVAAVLLLVAVLVITGWARQEVQLPDGSRGTQPPG